MIKPWKYKLSTDEAVRLAMSFIFERCPVIAVDFDGTLCEDRYPYIGDANMKLIDNLKKMQRRGVKIILWTCRCGDRLFDAIDWCNNLGLYFDAVNENVKERIEAYGNDSRKISADIYIDDKNLGCKKYKKIRRKHK